MVTIMAEMYYSATGTTYHMSQHAAEGASGATIKTEKERASHFIVTGSFFHYQDKQKK